MAMGDEFPMASPLQNKVRGMPMQVPHPSAQDVSLTDMHIEASPIEEPVDPEEYVPKTRLLRGHGGLMLDLEFRVGHDLSLWRPDIPSPQEMGNVDIHALTKSIQSGIHAEVRLALDALATLSTNSPHLPPLDLRYTEDLVESLVECAEDQIDLLADSSSPAADEAGLPPYEVLTRSCRLSTLALQSVHTFGSEEYLLDRAVERLLAITTTLRNFSFKEENHRPLADETVISFICHAIKMLGTRENLFRTPANTLEFMKDTLVLLSNIAGMVELPGPEEAYFLLEFLLAFGPYPLLTVTDDRFFFAAYEPDLHPYLPHAVDALAKLFARDEPNRTHYREIFSTQSPADSIPYELLTRAFALAISPIPLQPEVHRDSRPAHVPSLIEARKPLLMQGLLAADIVASLAPGYESGVSRSWLAAGNGFARSIDLLLRYLSGQFEFQAKQRGNQGRKDPDLVHMTSLAVRLLKRLSEKARDPADPIGDNSIPPNVLPSSESVLQAMSMVSGEWKTEGVLANLMEYASLED